VTGKSNLVSTSKILNIPLKNSVNFNEEAARNPNCVDSNSPYRLPSESKNSVLSGKKIFRTSNPEKKNDLKKMNAVTGNFNALSLNTLSKFKQTLKGSQANTNSVINNANIQAGKSSTKTGMFQSFNNVNRKYLSLNKPK
jgi:hypothetical protein